MTQDEIIEMARQAGLVFNETLGTEKARRLYLEKVDAFAKLVAEKSIQPYLPYKEKIEAMERAYDAHFNKAMGQA
jgi:hypothetical protein